MGRLKRRNKQKKRPSKRNRKSHGSDPERPGTETRENSPTTAWSCDEQGLLDYAQNAQVASDGSDEMEVTRRLSSLNFEVIPCALDPANFSCPPGNNHEFERCQKDANCSHTCGDGFSFGEELCTSATNLDVLPGIGEQGNHLSSRQSRKRASRRRPNKKVKKMKCSKPVGCSIHSHGRKMKRSLLSQARYNPMFTAQGGHSSYSPLSHAHFPLVTLPLCSARSMEVEEDSMSCLVSDTSAVCDVEMFQEGGAGQDTFDCTPSSYLSNGGFPPHHDTDADLFGSTSDLSESSTTDRYVSTEENKGFLCWCLITRSKSACKN